MPGSSRCTCPKGMTLDTDGKTCLGSNPCEVDNGGCNHICTDGGELGAICECRAGYELDASDQRSCVDIDECGDGGFGCSHECVNTPGQARCQCPEGMVLAPNQKECVDVNECLEDNGGCEQVQGPARGYGRFPWNGRTNTSNLNT